MNESAQERICCCIHDIIILYEGLSKFSYPLECSYMNGNANQTLGIRCLDVVIMVAC